MWLNAIWQKPYQEEIMSDYYIATDATIDLTQELVSSLELKVIPMSFILGNDTYQHFPDARELSYSDFYTRLQNGEITSTSQITPLQYEQFFGKLLDEEKDVIYIGFSSGLSSTYSASKLVAKQMAARYPDRRIKCIDSLCASIGEGLLVYLAARFRQAGRDFDSTVEYVEDIKTKICHWFMVEDLNQLRRGGRLSSFEAVIGSALHIHPILSTDPQGKLRVVSKTRGVRKALHYLRDRLIKDAYNPLNQTVIIGHANCPDYADLLAQDLMQAGLVESYHITQIGPVIGSHVGSGMCALVFLGENYKD